MKDNKKNVFDTFLEKYDEYSSRKKVDIETYYRPEKGKCIFGFVFCLLFFLILIRVYKQCLSGHKRSSLLGKEKNYPITTWKPQRLYLIIYNLSFASRIYNICNTNRKVSFIFRNYCLP